MNHLCVSVLFMYRLLDIFSALWVHCFYLYIANNFLFMSTIYNQLISLQVIIRIIATFFISHRFCFKFIIHVYTSVWLCWDSFYEIWHQIMNFLLLSPAAFDMWIRSKFWILHQNNGYKFYLTSRTIILLFFINYSTMSNSFTKIHLSSR